MQTRYNVLGYRIDLYFFVYNLAKEIDENGNSDRNVLRQLEKKRQNSGNKNSTVKRTKQNRLILVSNCAFSGK